MQKPNMVSSLLADTKVFWQLFFTILQVFLINVGKVTFTTIWMLKDLCLIPRKTLKRFRAINLWFILSKDFSLISITMLLFDTWWSSVRWIHSIIDSSWHVHALIWWTLPSRELLSRLDLFIQITFGCFLEVLVEENL